MRGRRLALVALMLGLCAPVRTLPSSDGADVAIRRTSHGIPHIVAESFRDMGYGYAYAFAEDNICTIASSYVTVRAERSRFFGPVSYTHLTLPTNREV